VGAQLSKPDCISHIGFAARQVLDVSGVDQHHLHARQILQQVVERLPIVAGGFHDDARNLLCGKMIPHRHDLAGGRSERGHCFTGPATACAVDTDTDFGILL
jgi:hypothetical protein